MHPVFYVPTYLSSYRSIAVARVEKVNKKLNVILLLQEFKKTLLTLSRFCTRR